MTDPDLLNSTRVSVGREIVPTEFSDTPQTRREKSTITDPSTYTTLRNQKKYTGEEGVLQRRSWTEVPKRELILCDLKKGTIGLRFYRLCLWVRRFRVRVLSCHSDRGTGKSASFGIPVGSRSPPVHLGWRTILLLTRTDRDSSRQLPIETSVTWSHKRTYIFMLFNPSFTILSDHQEVSQYRLSVLLSYNLFRLSVPLLCL